MDIQPATNQASKPISDDQELAKVLAGISKETNTDLSFGNDESPKVMGPVLPSNDGGEPNKTGSPAMPPLPPLPPIKPAPIAKPGPTDDDGADQAEEAKAPAGFTFDESMMPTMPSTPAEAVAPVASDTNLEGIRKDALLELRPLVDKLDLAPEEKFDIYLLLLRSTDDTTLIAPAHEAAKSIADESKRAEALLDIIKEIDFLSAPAVPK